MKIPHENGKSCPKTEFLSPFFQKPFLKRVIPFSIAHWLDTRDSKPGLYEKWIIDSVMYDLSKGSKLVQGSESASNLVQLTQGVFLNGQYCFANEGR
jgi:hypothetical protein